MSAIFKSIQVSDEVSQMIDHSFELVNKIHEIMEKQGKTQQDLANLIGRKESEISRWMQGTHDFRLSEIALIESRLGERLIGSPR
jgi:antitoxin component HigA of HigAB toxin-antitoxin module